MESLDGHAVKFSLKHILRLGQYDILSRCDSFGDIPGHGEIFFSWSKDLVDAEVQPRSISWDEFCCSL